jgi:hypothetical protein
LVFDFFFFRFQWLQGGAICGKQTVGSGICYYLYWGPRMIYDKRAHHHQKVAQDRQRRNSKQTNTKKKVILISPLSPDSVSLNNRLFDEWWESSFPQYNVIKVMIYLMLATLFISSVKGMEEWREYTKKKTATFCWSRSDRDCDMMPLSTGCFCLIVWWAFSGIFTWLSDKDKRGCSKLH